MYHPSYPFIGGRSRISVPVLPNLPPHLAMTAGDIWHVRPGSGSDSASGTRPNEAFKTLAKALAAATANQNDVVLLYSESNTTTATTDYLTTTLNWNKDLVHLIGVCSGNPYNQRARITWKSTAASESNIPLFTLSAHGCYIANLSFPVGSTDANLSFGVNVTGDRNRFENVSVPFPTNAANDVAGAYALKLDGADECLFKDCTFGSFTTDTGAAANHTLLVDGAISMTKFENCDFIARILSTTQSPHVKLNDANAVGFGCLWFKGCNFISTSVNFAYAQASAFKLAAALVEGRVVLIDCRTNAGLWDVDVYDSILNGCTGIPIGDTAGGILAV